MSRLRHCKSHSKPEYLCNPYYLYQSKISIRISMLPQNMTNKRKNLLKPPIYAINLEKHG